MSASLNKWQGIGRLGQDPEGKYTPSGELVVNIQIACDASYKNRDGEKVEKTEWVKLVLWGKQAEFVKEYLGKGDLVYVEGELQTRQWEDKRDGSKRYATEVKVFVVKGLSAKREQASPVGVTSNQGGDVLDDESIPF